MVAEAIGGSEQQSTDNGNKQECCNKSTNKIILEAELDHAREDLQDMQEKKATNKNTTQFRDWAQRCLEWKQGFRRSF